MSAAVILKTSFEYQWNVGSNDFLDYMDRPSAFKGKYEAIKQEIYDYMNYMSNEDKSDGLFTADKDVLMNKDVSEIRQLEQQSLNEGCPKYLGVVSFDNNFLRENGLIIGDRVDTEKLRSITRKAIANMVDESDKLEKDNCYWTAAIHFNTDNIHIHFQLLEKHRTEDRRVSKQGKGQDSIEKKALERLKSTVVNEVLNVKRTPMLTSLMRDVLIPGIGRNVYSSASVYDLLNKLPETNKAWQYKRSKMQPYRNEINKCIDEIVEANEDLKKSFNQFKETLLSMSEEYSKLYGNRNNHKVESYAEKQLNDFYVRAGNKLLQELFEIKNDSSLNLSGSVAQKSDAPSEKKIAGLIKKKYSDAKALIENKDNDSVLIKKGLEQMEKLKSENQYALTYLAFYYYRHRKENYEYNKKSIEYLKQDYHDNNNLTACYLLGKQLLENGRKKDGKDYIQLAADGDNKYAQYYYARLCKAVNKEYTATKYAMQAERNGVKSAGRMIQKRKYIPAKTRVRYSESILRCTQHSQIISNRCAATIEHLLAESDAHLKQLQSEFEYEIMREQNEYIYYEREY